MHSTSTHHRIPSIHAHAPVPTHSLTPTVLYIALHMGVIDAMWCVLCVPMVGFSLYNIMGASSSGAPVSLVVGAAIGRWWCEGESTVLLPKKRRGGVERNAKEERNGKKRRSPAVLMEGSRCSRVNGRGWRCCQQTLVGYSLFEHHLGKGRLRSVSSVQGSQVSDDNRKPKNNYIEKGEDGGSAVVLSSLQEEQEEKAWPQQRLGVDNGEKKGRKKIGTVKARSISSLLIETDCPMAAMISSSLVPTVDSKALV